jgi:hypothetical protein
MLKNIGSTAFHRGWLDQQTFFCTLHNIVFVTAAWTSTADVCSKPWTRKRAGGRRGEISRKNHKHFFLSSFTTRRNYANFTQRRRARMSVWGANTPITSLGALGTSPCAGTTTVCSYNKKPKRAMLRFARYEFFFSTKTNELWTLRWSIFKFWGDLSAIKYSRSLLLNQWLIQEITWLLQLLTNATSLVVKLFDMPSHWSRTSERLQNLNTASLFACFQSHPKENYTTGRRNGFLSSSQKGWKSKIRHLPI